MEWWRSPRGLGLFDTIVLQLTTAHRLAPPIGLVWYERPSAECEV
jgi:hypothetical protein